MELLLRREDKRATCTIGRLWVDGREECFTCEDRLHDGPKIPGETAIPAGRYRVRITRSTRFGRDLPLLCDVPGFAGIRIHPGNSAVDTDGCILVGQDREVDGVIRSRAAMAVLQPKIQAALDRHEQVWITVS